MEWSPGNPASRKRDDLSNPPASLADRRSEERFAADGGVELRFEDPIFRTVEGSLLDYSHSGFRAKHQFHSLHNGQCVEFRHVFGTGKARVMWNRILPEGVETGFLVVPEARDA